MDCIQKNFKILKNEEGFTLVELLVASVLSVLMLALIAGIFQLQNNTFVLQNQLNKMQVNGRAATEFLSRAVQNAGYNVFRGTRFLAASDHYLTAVYDQDNDGVIQNDEVMTFGVGNTFGSADETFNIDPFFDMDQDGTVEGTETATFPVAMTLTSPPYNLYKVIPDNAGTGITRHTVARGLDNLTIRFYDKNGSLLPAGIDADNDGVPDTGSYVVPLAELNDIRKVDIQVLARTRDEDPREAYSSTGTYVTGSVATQGGSTYSDGFHRQTFASNMAPRNLVMAPWGKIDILANPVTVECPSESSSVTATLVDSNGVPVSAGVNINFAVDGGGNATVSPTTVATNSLGEATATVSYNWASPTASITVSASSLITVGGNQNPVFNASSVNFQSGSGTFTDTFNGGLDPDWEEANGPTMYPFDADGDTVDDSYRMDSFNFNRAVNGCAWQDYQVEFELTPSADLDDGRYVGGYIRYEDANSNYSALLYKQASGNCVSTDGHSYCLTLIKWNGAVNELARIGVHFDPGVKYKIRVQAEGSNLRAKIWDADALGTADPNPGVWVYDSGFFPSVYPITAVDADIGSGKVGFLGDFNNGTNVVFDNIVASPIS
jgi:type II secretory pathway pseudopilin PulG